MWTKSIENNFFRAFFWLKSGKSQQKRHFLSMLMKDKWQYFRELKNQLSRRTTIDHGNEVAFSNTASRSMIFIFENVSCYFLKGWILRKPIVFYVKPKFETLVNIGI